MRAPIQAVSGRILRLAVPLLLAGIFSGTLRGMEPDVESWSRLSIKKAVISRATFSANRDAMSAPEFGWNARMDGRTLRRGDLYDDYYYPAGESEALELVFVESDVFADDDIQIFNIDPGNGVKNLRNGEDEFTIERSTVVPDRASGRDGQPSGASALKEGEDHEDTVCFVDGDMTDYFTGGSSAASVLFIRDSAEARLETRPQAIGDFFTGSLGRYILIDAPSGLESIRVRAEPGSHRIPYILRTFSGTARKNTLIARLFQDAANRNSVFVYREAAQALNEFYPAETASYCRSLGAAAPVRVRIACVYYLYPNGEDQDRKRIEQQYTAAGRELKEAIESMRLDFENRN